MFCAENYSVLFLMCFSIGITQELRSFTLRHTSDIDVADHISEIHTKDYVKKKYVTAVEGGSAALPCSTTPPNNMRDRIKLVLWFKNESAIPIYTFDSRDKYVTEARHWSDAHTIAGRAFFKEHEEPPHLALENIMATDVGSYKCRVDFYKAPTQISEVVLRVIVPPEKPKIFDMRGQEVRMKLGPYKIGDSAIIRCETWGGSPPPQLNWWREHALIDGSYESSEPHKIINTLLVENLQREDLHSILTCQASNNNISNPVSTSVKIDLHFGPLSVSLLNSREHMSAGKRFEAKCQVVGARPPPKVTWWRGASQIRDNITTNTSPDGNVTLSTMVFIPSIRDAGKFLGCRAADQQTGEGSLEDGWELSINYVPQAILSLGFSLNGSNIKEGDDVYFECNVRSNPWPYKITWRRNEKPLMHNVAEGVIVSNMSLVLQRVSKFQSGIYTCVAHNSEGDGVSNPITLNVRYVPYCRPEQVLVYGVARYEKVKISCDVVSNPSFGLSFHWVFNTSGETVQMKNTAVKVDGTRSIVNYVPKSELDYGNLLCWGENSIGVQTDPCTYHIIPAGRPDPVHNCSVYNQTLSSIQVTCGSGFDGGLRQTFKLELRDARTNHPIANISHDKAEFIVRGLLPGEGYIITLYSVNGKGSSEPVIIHAFTMKETSPEHIVADTSRHPGMVVTPVLAILIAIISGLALVAICIILVMRIKHGNTNRGYHASHIPLQKRISSHHCLPENDPDIIPTNKEFIQEEEAFEKFREQQFATIARRHRENELGSSKGLRGNLSRLSEEVTYAELTLPRGKGYSPMIKSQNSTLYAKIDHSRSVFSGILSPSGSGGSRTNTCFSGSIGNETEEITSQTPLVGKAQYVIYSPIPGDDRGLKPSSRESKV